MKLSVNDRIQAIIRHPQYLKDYFYILGLKKANHSSYRLEKEYSQILQKWEIERLLEPVYLQDPARIPKASKEVLEYLSTFSRRSPTSVLSSNVFEVRYKLENEWAGSGLLGKFATKQKKANVPKRKPSISRLLKEIHSSKSLTLEKGRYLMLRIDLRAGRGEIIKDVKEKVDFYRDVAKPPKGKIGKTLYDPWLVYDLRKQGKKYEGIIMQIDPTDDKDLLLLRTDAARKAYDKACRMIRAVEPSQ